MRALVVLTITFSCIAQLSNAAIDTIIVHVDTVCNDFMPHREKIVVPAKTDEEKTEYYDSIRVCGQIVEGFRKHYYLIVYDKQHVKRMEGTFYDHLADGHCITYDYRGRKISEGGYKLVRKKRTYYPSVKTGTWIYYDISGGILKKETY